MLNQINSEHFLPETKKSCLPSKHFCTCFFKIIKMSFVCFPLSESNVEFSCNKEQPACGRGSVVGNAICSVKVLGREDWLSVAGGVRDDR